MRPNNRIFKAIMAFSLLITTQAFATGSTDLSKHDFFYAGESKQPRMYIVKNGVIEWEHLASERKGEISDAVLMTDGNMLIAHQYGIAEIAPNHSIIWSYDAPEGC